MNCLDASFSDHPYSLSIPLIFPKLNQDNLYHYFWFQGLVVPVIRNVESMNYADIELTINALGEKARKGALAIEDMDGGTFTISNGGVFGSLFGTPIINPPQSAILGMHGTFERPVAIKGQVQYLVFEIFVTKLL